jgi:hypothetical protein
MTNIFQSKAPLMVVLRYLLVGAVILMGLARLRNSLLLLAFPENFKERDILQIYLMAKGLVSGLNPYLPLNVLAEKFIGSFPYYPHPSPYPPINAILITPLLALGIRNIVIVWYIFELLCLAAIACLLIILWKGRLGGAEAIILFFIMLAWYPVIADLTVGQLSILLTLLLLAALLALQRNHRVLAGVFIGFTVAIKMITWPLIIYLILKKDWRTAITSILTTLGLNLVALLIMGFRPILDYYLHVTNQVLKVYQNFWANYSMFSIGYRLFEGTDSAIFIDNFHAPALVNLPSLAPWVSIGFMASFTVVCLVWAIRSNRIETSFAILVCLIVAISPLVWSHYFVMLIISMVVMYRILVRHSLPAMQTLIFVFIVLLLFLFNFRINSFIVLLNGGKDLLQAHGNQITFASSLLSWLPLLEIVVLSMLLWRSEKFEKQG